MSLVFQVAHIVGGLPLRLRTDSVLRRLAGWMDVVKLSFLRAQAWYPWRRIFQEVFLHDRNAGQLENIPGLDGRRRPLAQRNATQLGQRCKETIPDYENARLLVAQALGMLPEDLPSPPQDVAMAVINVCSTLLTCGEKRGRDAYDVHVFSKASGTSLYSCSECCGRWLPGVETQLPEPCATPRTLGTSMFLKSAKSLLVSKKGR